VILGVHINYSSFDTDRTLSEYQSINPPSEPLESLTTKAEREKVFDQLRRRIEELLEPSGPAVVSAAERRLGRIYGDGPKLPPDCYEPPDSHAEPTNKQGFGSAAKHNGWKITLLVIWAGIITVWIIMAINRDPLLPDASESVMFLIAGAAMIVTWLVAKLWWFR